MKALTKLFVVNGIGIVACLLLAFLLIRPTLGKFTALNQQLRDKKTQAKALDQQILAFKSAQADLSRATERDRISSAVLEREDLVDVVQNVESAAEITASTHSISIVDQLPDVKLPPPVIKNLKNTTEVEYTLNVKNNFKGALDFLKYMEHLPHFTEITALRLTADTIGAGPSGGVVRTGNVTATISGIFFVKGSPAPVKPKTNEPQTQSKAE